MRRPLCILCLCYVVAVMVFSGLFPPSFASDVLPGVDYGSLLMDGSQYEVCGEVEQIEIKKDKSILYLKSDIGQIICYFPNNTFTSVLKIGNIIKVNGTVRLFEAATNPGQFDARDYYGILGYAFALSGCEGQILNANYRVYDQGLYWVKRRLASVFDNGLPEKYAGVMKAMLLGEKGDMDPEIKELYQQNGIAHILAISALHITFLGRGLFGLCKKMRLPIWLASLLSLFMVISYGKMTGSSASTVRSVIMFSLFLTAGVCGRTYDMITAMSVSAVVLLLVNPRYIYHSGFLLSFGAVMGIALLSPIIKKWMPNPLKKRKIILTKTFKEKFQKRLWEKLISSLSTNLSVVFATLPIQLYFFYTFSTYSIVLNLVVVPLVGVVMAAGVFGGILGCFVPFSLPEKLLLLPCRVVLWFYEMLCRIANDLPGNILTLGQPDVWQIGLYYTVLLGVVLWDAYGEKIRAIYEKKNSFGLRGRKNKKTFLSQQKHVVATMVGVLIILILCIRPRFLTTCNMLDIGQGDCIVILEKSGCNIMVDGGSSDVSSVGKYRIIPYLQSQGIGKLDYVFVSHADSDHISGILEMLTDESEPVEISCLVLTKFALSDEAYGELLNAAHARGVRVLYVATGDRFRIGETTWTCLYPDVDEVAEGNDQSMVLMMECGESEMKPGIDRNVSPNASVGSGISILFTGDLTEAKEDEIYVPDVDILKVGHHGSRYSTTEAFLTQCQPEIAIISAGKDNMYEHPHEEVLKRLDSAGVSVFVTKDSGMIDMRVEEEIKVYIHK